MALTKVTGHVVLPTTNIEFHNTKSTGIVTFTHTSNATSSTTGALQITGGVGIVKDLFVGGNITVGGTITYDDVTNIDSLGIITARNNIHLQDYIYHRGEDPLNSYFGFPADDTIDFFTDGGRRLRIQSSGRIGINTDSARVNGLHIYDKHLAVTEGYPLTWLQPNSSASRGRMAVDSGGNYLFQFGTGNEEKIRFNDDGEVGIGTNNPGEILHVNKNSGTACILVSSSTAPQIRFNPNATDGTDGDRSILGQATGNSQFVNSAVSGDTILRGTSSGNIKFGIGTDEKVRITNSGNLEIINNNDYLKIGAGGALSMVFTGGQSYITNSTGHLTGRSASYTWENLAGTAEYARITSTGKVGIGTVSALGTVDIYNSGSDASDLNSLGAQINAAWIRIGDVDAGGKTFSNGLGTKLYNQGTAHWSYGVLGTDFLIANTSNDGNKLFPSNRTAPVIIKSDGKVGIGTENPDSKLNLVGSGSDANTRISFKDGVGIANVVGRYGNLVFQTDADNAINGSVMVFEIDGSEAFRVDSNRQIGIGTIPASGSTLDIDAVGGGVLALRRNSVSTNNKITLSSDGTNGTLESTNQILFRAGGDERLRITSGGHIVTQGLTSPSFNNDGNNAKVYEFTGDGTVGEYGVINISGNQNANGANIGNLRFVNRENSNSSSGGSSTSKTLSAIQVYNVTSDSNAGDDSGGIFTILTKPESGNVAERLRITSDGRIGMHDSSPNDYELDIMKRSTATDAQIRLYNNATGSGNDTVMRYQIAGTSANNYIYFGDGDDSNIGQIRYSHNTDSMQFTVNADERLRITSTGLIRMGNGAEANTEAHITAAIFQNTTGAATILKLGNTNTPSSANNRAIEFCDGTGGTEGSSKYTYARIRAERSGGSNAGRLMFFTKPDNSSDATEKLRIDSSGHLLPGANGTQDIGENSSSRWRNIYGQTLSLTSYATIGTIVANDPGSSYYAYNNRIGGGIAIVGTTRLFGNVGIGTNLSGGGGAYGRLSVVIPSQSGGSALQVMNSAVGSGDGSLTNIVLRSVNNPGTQWAGAEYRAQEHIFTNQTTEALRIDSAGNAQFGGVTHSGPWVHDGGSSNGARQLIDFGSGTANRCFGWGGTTANYANIWTEYSSGDLNFATGLRPTGTSTGYVSSYGDSSIGRANMELTLSGQAIFRTAASSTVANGTAVSTLKEKFRINAAGGIKLSNTSSGNLIESGGSTAKPNAAINIIRYGTGYADIRIASNYGAGILFAGAGDNTDEYRISQDNQKNAYHYLEYNGFINFATNTGSSTTAMRLENGKVGINKNLETLTGNGFAAALQVNNKTSDGYGTIMMGGGYNRATIGLGNNYDLIITSNAYPANATSRGIVFKCGSNSGGGPNERLRINSGGLTTVKGISPTKDINNNSAAALVNTSGRQLEGGNDFQTNGKSNLSVGWYTIAVSGSGRASARFGIKESASSRHQAVTFYAGHHFGGSGSQNCIHTIFHAGTHGNVPLGELRIKANGVYDGAMLQVYIRDSTNSVQAFLLGDNIQTEGWRMVDWIADGTDPGGLGSFSNINNNPLYPAKANLLTIAGGGASLEHTIPGIDDSFNLGAANHRWNDVYSMNSTNNTSDETLKQDIATLTTAEMNAAKRLSGLFKTYRWKKAVIEKGTDKARTHTGIIAQQVKTALEAESLDPSKYGFYCVDEWYEDSEGTKLPADEPTIQNDTTDVNDPTNPPSNGNIVVPEGFNKVTRYSVRYTELLAFIAAYNEQRFTSIESRLAALESS